MGLTAPNLPAEFSDVPFDRGVVGMARSQDPDSANSQFFIMFDEGHFLNGQYTVVGRVTEGMDVVDQIKRGHPRSGAITGKPRCDDQGHRHRVRCRRQRNTKAPQCDAAGLFV